MLVLVCMNNPTEHAWHEQVKRWFQGRLDEDEVFKQYYTPTRPVVKWGNDYVVYATRHKDQCPVVVRLIDRNSLDSRIEIDGERIKRDLEREINNRYQLLLLAHPQIENHSCVLLTDKFMALVADYPYKMITYDGQDLPTLASSVQPDNGLEEGVARWFFQQIVLGLDLCHKLGIAKRDLTLDDCVLHQPPDGDCRSILTLCGWRKSKADDIQPATSLVGAPGHWAPEVIVASCRETPYDPYAGDMFSLGVILFKLLHGRDIYPAGMSDYQVNLAAQEQRDELCQIAQNHAETPLPIRLMFPGDLSDECCELLNGLLQLNPQYRWSMDRVQHCLWYQTGLPAEAVSVNQTHLENPQVEVVPGLEDRIRMLLGAAPCPDTKDIVLDVDEWIRSVA